VRDIGLRGHSDQEIFDYAQSRQMPVHYLAGPPAMVEALKKLLLDRGVSRDNVRFESFSGY